MSMSIFSRALAGALAAMACTGAAWAVQPEPGMWGIDGEVNGRPGRGFQIDTQGGNLMIVTYFGYRNDGSPLFLQASGEQFNGVFDGPLVEYRNGTVLGGVFQNGVAGATLGDITIRFLTPTTGLVTLPDEEQPRAFSRLQFENHTDRLNNRFVVGVSTNGLDYLQTRSYTISASGGQFGMTDTLADGSRCDYAGTYAAAGQGATSAGRVACTDLRGARTEGSYRIEQMRVDARGMYSATFYRFAGTASEVVEDHTGICTQPGTGAVPVRPRCAFTD